MESLPLVFSFLVGEIRPIQRSKKHLSDHNLPQENKNKNSTGFSFVHMLFKYAVKKSDRSSQIERGIAVMPVVLVTFIYKTCFMYSRNRFFILSLDG